MDERVYLAQINHIRRITEAMRLLDLEELERQAQQHGTAADRALIASVLLALEILPADPSHS
jgi:hypothetical protein